MARKKGSTDYKIETKMQAIRMNLEEGVRYAEITCILGIRDPGRVKHWVSQYRRGGDKSLKKPRRGRPKKKAGEETLQEKIKQLEMENDLLKKYHAELQRDLPVRSPIPSHLPSSNEVPGEGYVPVYAS